jgi:hypothetical protein
MKICKKCTTSKEFSEFNKNKTTKDGFAYYCRSCSGTCSSTYYQKNRDKILEKRRKYYDLHPDAKKLVIKNSEKWRLANIERDHENKKRHYQLNKKSKRAYEKSRRRSSPTIRINSSMSGAIGRVLDGQKAFRSWKDLVGYSPKDMVEHLESKFTKGMTWGNYGKNGWVIDHIIPKSYFKYNNAESKAFKACWALENLQPLWETRKIAMEYGGEPETYIGNLEKVLEDINSF